MTARDTPSPDSVLPLLREAGLAEDPALVRAVRDIRALGAGPAPDTSAELAQLMADGGKTPAGRRNKRRITFIGGALAVSMGVGVSGVAAGTLHLPERLGDAVDSVAESAVREHADRMQDTVPLSVEESDQPGPVIAAAPGSSGTTDQDPPPAAVASSGGAPASASPDMEPAGDAPADSAVVPSRVLAGVGEQPVSVEPAESAEPAEPVESAQPRNSPGTRIPQVPGTRQAPEAPQRPAARHGVSSPPVQDRRGATVPEESGLRTGTSAGDPTGPGTDRNKAKALPGGRVQKDSRGADRQQETVVPATVLRTSWLHTPRSRPDDVFLTAAPVSEEDERPALRLAETTPDPGGFDLVSDGTLADAGAIEVPVDVPPAPMEVQPVPVDAPPTPVEGSVDAPPTPVEGSGQDLSET